MAIDGDRCPTCGSAAERVHRDIVDRWVSLFRSVHRVRCTNPACGWHGLLGRDPPSLTARAAPRWRARLAWFAIGVTAAMAAVQGVRVAQRQNRPDAVPVASSGARAQAQDAAPGADFPGEALPAADERVAANPSPLTLPSIPRRC